MDAGGDARASVAAAALADRCDAWDDASPSRPTFGAISLNARSAVTGAGSHPGTLAREGSPCVRDRLAAEIESVRRRITRLTEWTWSDVSGTASVEREHAFRVGSAVPDTLADCDVTSAAGYVFCEDFLRDDLGRIVEVDEFVDGESTTWAYAYDDAGRLIHVLADGLDAWEYDHDANGNRTYYRQWVTSGGPAVEWTSADVAIADDDRMTRYGDHDFAYSPAGHLVWSTDGSSSRCYRYGVQGGLHAVSEASGGPESCPSASPLVRYQVDPTGRRIARESTDGVDTELRRYVYRDGLNPVARLDEDGALEQRYVYGTATHTPDYVVAFDTETGTEQGAYRLVADVRGSVRLAIGPDGTVAIRTDYGPFGEIMMRTPAHVAGEPPRIPFGYAGGIEDPETGLVRFGARDYDPRLGRWTAKDPIRWRGGQANLYEYVEGDPVNRVDPTGTFFRDCNQEDEEELEPLDDLFGGFDPCVTEGERTSGGFSLEECREATRGWVEPEDEPVSGVCDLECNAEYSAALLECATDPRDRWCHIEARVEYLECAHYCLYGIPRPGG